MLTLFCPPSHPLAKQKRVRWRDLRDHRLIMLTRDSNIRALVDRALRDIGENGGKPLYEVSQMTTAIMLVEAGLGAAVLPSYIWSFARDRQIVLAAADRAAGQPPDCADPCREPVAITRCRSLSRRVLRAQARAAIARVVK